MKMKYDGLSEDEIYAKYFGKYDMEMIRNIITL